VVIARGERYSRHRSGRERHDYGETEVFGQTGQWPDVTDTHAVPLHALDAGLYYVG
jgi:hypothetical protein